MSERRSPYGNPTEHDEQVALMTWVDLNGGILPEITLLFAIPNGTRTTPGVAHKMHLEGVKRGVPDLFLPVARGKFHGLFIEMKTKTGTLRPEQKQWATLLVRQGYAAVVCRSFEEARDALVRYLETE